MASTAVCGNLASLPRARFVKNPVILPRPALCLFFVGGLASPNSRPGSVYGFGTHCLLLCELLFRLITRWRRRRKLSPVLRLFLILLLLYLLVLLLLLLHLFGFFDYAVIVAASKAGVTTVPSTASSSPVPDDYPAFLNKCHVACCAAVIMQIHNDTLVSFDFPKCHATGKDWNSRAKAYLKKELQTIENPAYDIMTAYDIITADFLE